MSDSNVILILAGPNGAGKTTFAREFLLREAAVRVFVNADLIAAGLSPFDPKVSAIRAGRIMLEEIHNHVRAGRSFAFETTLSGRLYSRWIPGWRRRGYEVKLIFLSLATLDLAISRVGARILQGGHGIDGAVVARRFAAGLRNFDHLYKPLVNYWALYDNSGDAPVLVETGGGES